MNTTRKALDRTAGTMAGLMGAILTVLLLSACSSEEVDTAESIKRAENHLSAGELRAATIELKNALKESPQHADARLLLGKAYVRMGTGDAAEKELRRAAKLGKALHEVVYWHARAVFQQRDHGRLIEEFEVQAGWPPKVRAQVGALKARALALTGQPDEARASLEEAGATDAGNLEVRLARIHLSLLDERLNEARRLGVALVDDHPESGRAWDLLARVYVARNELDPADEALGKAIEATHQPHRQRLLRAQVRLSRGDAEAARQDVEWLRKNASEHPAVTFAEGLLAWAGNNPDEACSHFAQALSQAPSMRQAQYYVGVCKYREGAYNQAERHLEEAHQGVSVPRIAKVLAATYIAQGRPEQAREVLRPVLQNHPEDVAALGLMARIERASGNTSDMLEHLRRLAELRPEDPGVHLQLGYGLFRAGAIAQGQAALGEALSIEPELGQASAALVISHIRQDQFSEALALARELAEKQPDSALPWTLQGLTHLAREDREAADEALQKAVAIDPSDPGTRHVLARLEMADGDPAAAGAHYQSVLDGHPQHTSTLIGLARLEASTGNPERVGPLLRRAHESDPEAMTPRILLARFLNARGEHEQALELVRAPDGSTRSDPRARAVAAIAHLEQGRPAQALEQLDHLIESRSEDPGAYMLLARAYSALGQGEKARQQLQRVLELDQDNPLALLLEARVEIRDAKLDSAGELLDRVPEQAREHPLYLQTRARLAAASGNTDRAIELYRQAHGSAPSSATAINLAAAHIAAGDAEQAERVLKGFLDEKPADTEVRQTLGDLYVRLGREQEAAYSYRQVLEQNPGSVEALNNLGWVLRRDNPEEALRYAEEAAKLQPQDPRVIDTLAMVLLEAGRLDRAEQRMRDALSLAPEAPVLRYHLARILAAAGKREEARDELESVLGDGRPFGEVEEARELLEELEAGS